MTGEELERLLRGDGQHRRPASLAGRLISGLSVAALPLIGVRFYYHESDSLKALVTRYTQQALKGMTPAELARFLPPPLVRLEAVTVRIRQKTRTVVEEKDRPALAQVAAAPPRTAPHANAVQAALIEAAMTETTVDTGGLPPATAVFVPPPLTGPRFTPHASRGVSRLAAAGIAAFSFFAGILLGLALR